MKVIKRDGTTVDFDPAKIRIAIQKANDAVDDADRISEQDIDEGLARIARFVSELK